MGIVNPASMSQRVFEGSVKVTSPLVNAIATHDQDQKVDIFKVMEVKLSIRQSKHEHRVLQFKGVYDHLSPQLKRYVDLAKENGASFWLSVLPLDDHGFFLHRGTFKDAICLFYGWKLPNTPYQMPLWHSIHNQPCHDLSYGWLPYCTAQ